MKLIFSPSAIKSLRKLPGKEAAALLALLKEIAATGARFTGSTGSPER